MSATETRGREALHVAVAYRCARCKAAARVDLVHSFTRVSIGHFQTRKYDNIWTRDGHFIDRGEGVPSITCKACGYAHMWGKPIQGRINPAIKCGAKCTHAKGHVCECECGGANHGAGNCAT